MCGRAVAPMVDIDSETLFNAAAAIVATIAVVFFVTNVDFGYSPVSKVALVVAFLAGVFVITQRSDDHQLTLFGYGVIVTSVLALFFDLTSTFSVGNTLTVAGLLVIASVLFVLRGRLDEENHFVTGRQARTALAVVAVLTVAVLAVDVATGGLTYELQTQSQVEVPGDGHEPVQVGTLVVENPTPFPERVDTPRYAVCTAGNWSAYRRPTEQPEPKRDVRANLYIDDRYNDHVMGFNEKQYAVTLRIEGANLTGESFPVERTASCPDTETGSPYLAIFEAPEDQSPYYYAV